MKDKTVVTINVQDDEGNVLSSVKYAYDKGTSSGAAARDIIESLELGEEPDGEVVDDE